MRIHEYITAARRTAASAIELIQKWTGLSDNWRPLGAVPNEINLLHALAGLVSERGELAYETRTPQDLLEERGDVCWYLALMLDALPPREDDRSVMTPSVQHFMDGFQPCASAVSYASELDRYLHLASDIIKAYAFYGRTSFKNPLLPPTTEPEDALVVLRELSYIMLSIVGAAALFDANIAKLRARYPEKFTEADANARADKQEEHQDV